MTTFIILLALLGGLIAGIYLLRKNSPNHYAVVKEEAKKLAENIKESVDKIKNTK